MLETQCSTMQHLHQLHSHAIKTGLSKDPIAISRFLSFTVTTPSPDLDYALLLFHHADCPTLFMWNTLIRPFSDGSSPRLAISIFQQMLLSPTPPNHLTFPSLFKSCSRLNVSLQGSQLHAMVIKLGLSSTMYAACGELAPASRLFHRRSTFDAVPWNAMILGLSKIGCVDEWSRLFDEMPTRTVITWSSMISGYVRNGRNREAFDLFHRMQREGLKPNEHILVSLLGACSASGALEQGKWIHSFIKRNITHSCHGCRRHVLQVWKHRRRRRGSV
ncbi:Pentatricopeptide repeat-containing protein [Platanthera guangdongensis]|uniref:Pentatricopeptide repeat-containing protein n=1 Tax=Platanthera guangdongensis TaxID=2320717 RepID=A0ABR2MJL9_9ASPA